MFYQRGQRLPIDRQVSLNIKTTDHLGGSDELEKAASGLSLGQNAPCISLEQDPGPLRRALIYGAVSYGGLVLINNSELDLPNMWIAYLPMFVGVYVLTQWLDRKFGG